MEGVGERGEREGEREERGGETEEGIKERMKKAK